jgi:uncharacterized phage protein (TIGR01671 family)
MREIKFRVWDEENTKMYSIDNLHFGYLGRGHGEYTSEDFYYGLSGHASTLSYKEHSDLKLNYSKIHILQYTGIKDKHGKDVYVGDIVRYNRRGGIMANSKNYCNYVEYSRIMGMDTYHFHNDSNQPINNWNFLFDTFEIIGNIYENPELIKTEV